MGITYLYSDLDANTVSKSMIILREPRFYHLEERDLSGQVSRSMFSYYTACGSD